MVSAESFPKENLISMMGAFAALSAGLKSAGDFAQLKESKLAGRSGLGPGDQIALSHWLCPPGPSITSVCVSPTAQLVAVGLSTGEVALYRLWGDLGSDPLRTISLREWGHEPEMTGSVSDLQWSPDSRALAVSPAAAPLHTCCQCQDMGKKIYSFQANVFK